MLIREEGREKVCYCLHSNILGHRFLFRPDFDVISFDVGAFAAYLEPWHADIFDFLELRKNHGKVCFIY